MSGNTFGTLLKVTTWGESHGVAIGCVVDGCPAGLELSEADVQRELDRRRPGQSDVTTQRTESDSVRILSGTFRGVTTGTPISMIVFNQDADSSKYDRIVDLLRPGHADYTYHEKYGVRDHRGGGRASARETIGRVAAGAVAKKLLREQRVEVLGHVIEIGGIKAENVSIDQIRSNVEANPVRCADTVAWKVMLDAVVQAKEAGESLGGIVEIVALDVPPGVGEPIFNKLNADLAAGLMGIGAVKGVEIGAGFKAASMRGSEMNDSFEIKDGRIHTTTNNAGGILGGISTGEPIITRIAVKPTPSIAKPQKTVNIKKMEESELRIEGRHDPAIPPRIVPVAEAMVALVLADHMIQNGFIHPSRLDRKLEGE
ncbi:MAG TPA: chorismate synthase [Candidatus Methanoperedenaceae archaeon]|nr:chorismate synthase [Candidatus Methanoperedenaceae archaeon]